MDAKRNGHPPVLFVITLWFLLLGPASSVAAHLAGRVYSELYQLPAAGGVGAAQKQAVVYAGGQLSARGLTRTPGALELDGFVSARVRERLEADRSLDPAWFLYQGYLALRHGSFQVARLGRQFVATGFGARTADGLWLSIRPARHWRWTGFLGARVDPLAPQQVNSLAEAFYAGSRLTLQSGSWRVGWALQWEKQGGAWWCQVAGADARMQTEHHEVELRLAYDFLRDRTDVLHLGYTLRPVPAWHLAASYQRRQPRTWIGRHVGDDDEDEGAEEIEAELRNAATVIAGIDFGRMTRLTAVVAAVFTGERHALRYGATLLVHRVSVAYQRREGHGPAHDRISFRGSQPLHRTLAVSAGLGLSQYNLDGSAPDSDRRAAAASLGARWQPSRRWVTETEVQVFDAERASNDLRLYVRLEHRFGGGR